MLFVSLFASKQESPVLTVSSYTPLTVNGHQSYGAISDEDH